jgi:hypothetical protein
MQADDRGLAPLISFTLVTWLAGLNSRHLRVNLLFIAAFVAGLVWPRGRAS